MDAFCPYKASAEAIPMLSTDDMGKMTNLLPRISLRGSAAQRLSRRLCHGQGLGRTVLALPHAAEPPDEPHGLSSKESLPKAALKSQDETFFLPNASFSAVSVLLRRIVSENKVYSSFRSRAPKTPSTCCR